MSTNTTGNSNYNVGGKSKRDSSGNFRVQTPTSLQILDDEEDMSRENERIYERTSQHRNSLIGGHRDFHYSIIDYRGPSSVKCNSSVNVYSRPSPRNHSREYFRDKGTHLSYSSPYHHESSRVQLRNVSDRNGEYLVLRSQQQAPSAGAASVAAAAAAAAAAEYDRLQHHSGSRSDLLEHDLHSIYDSYASQNQYSFVRTCDGNFVKTFIPPLHQLESFENESNSGTSFYRANHTLRRPNKRSADYCCNSQNYATLRGRKWTEKTRGCGDNYGRNETVMTVVQNQPLNSSFTDEILPCVRRSISQSTERNLNGCGVLENESLQCSKETLSLLTREPPDGKEKPEPIKSNSRKGSKADLLLQLDSKNEETIDTQSSILSLSNISNCIPPLSSSSIADSLNTVRDTRKEMEDKSEWSNSGSSPRCSMSTHCGPSQCSLSTSGKNTVFVSNAIASSLASSPQLQVTRLPSQPQIQQVQQLQQQQKPLNVSTPFIHTYTSSCGLQSSPYTLTSPAVTVLSWHESFKRYCRYVTIGTSLFFGVNEEEEESIKMIWSERRRRFAIKLFGGIKDEVNPNIRFDNAYNAQYGDSSRLRYETHLTSEMEGDKMVLKINRPPRNKDSFSSLTKQSLLWIMKMFLTRQIPNYHVIAEHHVSRSYQPSTTGIAAYYQAEQCGGLAVCPPLPRVPSSHHMHGESFAEEIFFTKPNDTGCEDIDYNESHSLLAGKRLAYITDPYRASSCSWQLPRPNQDIRRMSSDIGASRIWNRLLDSAFDNSDRRKHGMGILGQFLHRKKMDQRNSSSNSSNKQKLGGNSNDHRPYFTYWISSVQIIILLLSIFIYGIGPIGLDFYKKTGMVLVTNLELEPIDHMEAANFWIGPSAIHLIHLGAKYAPCMRYDEALDKEIQDERLKERDTACCIRKDRAGCVQSPKSECSKINDPSEGSPPRSNWWRPAEWGSKYPIENRRSSGPVCGLDPAYCEAPASVAPYIWPDDITKWPICRKKTEVENQAEHTAEHMICEIIGHPCCIGIRGNCQITTREYCNFVAGTFHEEAALCSQVACLNDVCGLLSFRHRDVPDQFYRAWTPIFLHAGILHLSLTLAIQVWLMRDLEKMTGAGRLSIIYIGSGMIGNVASAIFVPRRAEVGPSGCHFGLIASCIVEVLHEWPTLKYPEIALLKLLGVSGVFLLAGLLPWIDNYGHCFGFLGGLLLSTALLPFASFGIYDRRKKILLIWICLASTLFIFLCLLLVLYMSPLKDCKICEFFTCIPLTKDFCSDITYEVRDVL